MNILRKLSTLIKAMASQGTDEQPAGAVPTQVDGAGVVPTAEETQQVKGKRAAVPGEPLDRSRVADLLERQEAPGQDAPAQRRKGDRP